MVVGPTHGWLLLYICKYHLCFVKAQNNYMTNWHNILTTVCMVSTYVSHMHTFFPLMYIQLYLYGPSEGDTKLNSSLDVESDSIMLSEKFYFYNQTICDVYVS